MPKAFVVRALALGLEPMRSAPRESPRDEPTPAGLVPAGVPAGGLQVHFTVVDDTGARVPGARVNLVDPTRTKFGCGNSVLARGPAYETKQLAANEQGELTATLDFTPLEVSASAEDFWSEPVVEFSGEPMTLRLKRIPLVHWRGTITDKAGAPIAREVRVEAQRDGQRVSFCTTQRETPAGCTLDGEPGPITLLFGWNAELGRQSLDLQTSTSIRWVMDR